MESNHIQNRPKDISNGHDKSAINRKTSVFFVFALCALIACAFPLLGLQAPGSDAAFFLLNFLAYALWTLPALLACARYKPQLWAIGFGKKKVIAANLAGAGLLALMLVCAWALCSLLGVPDAFWGAFRARPLWYYLLAAAGEEFVFRGYVQGELSERWGKGKAYFVTAALFSVVHLPQRVFAAGYSFPGALLQCAVIFPAALMFGGLRLFFGNVYAAVWFHFGVNLVLSMLF